MANPTRMIEPVSFRIVFAAQRGLISLLFFFGSLVNILVLTGPIFALQVYDRVLSSRSQETLVSLTLIMAFLFLTLGILDHARKRIAARIGELITSSIEQPIFKQLGNCIRGGSPPLPESMKDIEVLRQFFGSPLLIALTDLIWIPLFIVALAVLHPALGLLAIFSGGAFLIPAILHLAIKGSGRPDDVDEYQNAAAIVGNLMSSARLALTIAPVNEMYLRWQSLRNFARFTALKSQDKRALLTSSTQTFRIFLQSATIALGAFLVLREQLTAGAIIASTVLLARALAPLDIVSQNTQNIAAVVAAGRRLSKSMAITDNSSAINSHFEPGVFARQLTVFPPDRRRAALRMINFDLTPGMALGVTGPSGSGKSALVKSVVGLWHPSGGTLSIGQVCPSQTPPIGYLPQYTSFLSGSIAQNIIGFRTEADSTAMIAAARASGAHGEITALQSGYETKIGPDEIPFSGGLAKRICLARALFLNPCTLVLDQPDYHLDHGGIEMVSDLITSAKLANQCVLVTSNEPSTLSSCDQVLVLESGAQLSLKSPLEHRNAAIPLPRKFQ